MQSYLEAVCALETLEHTKIKRALAAFEPMWTVLDGIEELYEAYKANNLTLEDLEGSRYLRIKHIRRLMAADQIDVALRWKECESSSRASEGGRKG